MLLGYGDAAAGHNNTHANLTTREHKQSVIHHQLLHSNLETAFLEPQRLFSFSSSSVYRVFSRLV
jgi:hypothetical protein